MTAPRSSPTATPFAVTNSAVPYTAILAEWVTTAAGDAYTFAEYEQIFAKVGFARSEFRVLPPTAQQAVVSYRA